MTAEPIWKNDREREKGAWEGREQQRDSASDAEVRRQGSNPGPNHRRDR